MKSLTLTFILLVIAVSSFAQVTATASTSATIVTPIAISKTVDMDFGNVAVLGTSGGTVILTPAGTRTKTGGVTLPATTGTVSAASFTVTGATGYTYAITLPSSDITLSDGATHTMTVGTFTSNPSGTGTLTGGTSTLTVGATLNVSAGQVAGAYTNAADLAVTVNYN
jgi:hypothetical protein